MYIHELALYTSFIIAFSLSHPITRRGAKRVQKLKGGTNLRVPHYYLHLFVFGDQLLIFVGYHY